MTNVIPPNEEEDDDDEDDAADISRNFNERDRPADVTEKFYNMVEEVKATEGYEDVEALFKKADEY